MTTPRPADQEPPASAEASQPTPRLLLVDDEPGLRSAVQAYLEDEGFEVTTAVDGEEGFAKAQQLLPDLVISDVMMPRAVMATACSVACAKTSAWAAPR